MPIKARRFIFAFILIFSFPLFFHPQPVSANQCGGPIPPQPQKVWAFSGPGPGQVTLRWDQVPHANRYAVAYGNASNSYQYGADSIGTEHSTDYTVSSLVPGRRYYFRLAAAHGCASSPFSSEVQAVATTGMQPVAASSSPAAWTSSGPVGKHGLWASSGPKTGEVTLYWHDAETVNNYHIVYGSMKGTYLYGALNIGNVHSFTISKLNPGFTYYAAIVPVRSNQALYTSDPVMVTAKASFTSETPTMTPPSNQEATPTPAQEGAQIPTVPGESEEILALESILRSLESTDGTSETPANVQTVPGTYDSKQTPPIGGVDTLWVDELEKEFDENELEQFPEEPLEEQEIYQ